MRNKLVFISRILVSSFSHVLAVATVRDVDETAAGQSNEDKPTISVYDMTSSDLKYVFVEPDGGGVSRAATKDPPRYFRHVQFLYDNMFMAALATNHDGTGCSMYCYRWRNSTVDTCVRIDGHVAAVSVTSFPSTEHDTHIRRRLSPVYILTGVNSQCLVLICIPYVARRWL